MLCFELFHSPLFSFSRDLDLLSILTKVNDDVSLKTKTEGEAKQMPQQASTLRMKVVFPVPKTPSPILPSVWLTLKRSPKDEGKPHPNVFIHIITPAPSTIQPCSWTLESQPVFEMIFFFQWHWLLVCLHTSTSPAPVVIAFP